jgi:osmotically-inducible protein OsmY
MKSNEDLQRNVQEAIKCEPLLHAAEIGVTVKDGIVSLTGSVDSYAKKIEAENAAKNVGGVKAIVENITIHYSNIKDKNNLDIAQEVLSALKWNWEIPNDTVKVSVENGWVTLEGVLEWNFQRESAKKSIKNIIGLKGITDKITLKSTSQDKIEKKDIESAYERNWSINDKEIHVAVDNNKVTLTGTVRSIYEKEEAERIAWNSHGVLSVKNNLAIEYDYSLLNSFV